MFLAEGDLDRYVLEGKDHGLFTKAK